MKNIVNKDKESEKKVGFFSRIMIAIGIKKPEVTEESSDDEEEEEPPNFVPIKTFTMNKKVYEKPLKAKDIKSIYKRLAPE